MERAEIKRLLLLDEFEYTVEIKEISTGKTGVASMHDVEDETDVQVFFGADDGSDDCEITLDAFIERFEITKVIKDEDDEVLYENGIPQF